MDKLGRCIINMAFALGIAGLFYIFTMLVFCL